MKITKKVKSIQMFRKPVGKIVQVRDFLFYHLVLWFWFYSHFENYHYQGDRAGICVTQFDPSSLERGIICSPGSVQTLYAVILEVTKISYFKEKCLTKSKFHISLGHETIMAKVLFFSSQSPFSIENEYLYEDELLDESSKGEKRQFALLEFDQPVITASQSLAIASKLDIDIHSNTCRLAFQASLLFCILPALF